jgi:hypothetical protein
MIANHFPTDPVKDDPRERSPWTLRFDAVPFERFALEATGGDGGAGFGLRSAVYMQEDLGFDLTLGIDELFFAPQSHLFGLPHESGSSRVWIGAARGWKWARLSASAAVVPEHDDVEYVPYLGAEALLPFHSSFGIETSYLGDVWRCMLGVSLEWTPFVIGFGMTEVQSWFVRDGEYGFFNEARAGSATGLDNPGWWFSVAFDLPSPPRPAPPPPPAPAGASLDSAGFARIEKLVVERGIRADVAELALRYSAEGVDPLESGALRRRILSGGAAARPVLVAVASDTSVRVEERTLALSMAMANPTDADLPDLERLTEEAAPAIRVETAFALRKLEGPRAKELLKRLRNDPDEIVRTAAGGE